MADSVPKDLDLIRNASKVQGHLRRLLGNQKLRLAPTNPKIAELRLDDLVLGKLVADVADDSWTLSVEIPPEEIGSGDAPGLKRAEAFLRARLGVPKLNVIANEKSLPEVRIGSENVGFIRMNDRKVIVFDLYLLSLDIEDDEKSDAPRKADASDVEPVDMLNSTYFARTSRVPVRETPSEDAPAVAQLSEGQKVKVTGKTRNSARSEERWHQLEFADGKPRFVQGKDLLSEKTQQYKSQYKSLLASYEGVLQQIGNSQGKLAKYMGFYTLGQDCRLQPFQVKEVKGFEAANAVSQRTQDVFWSSTSYALWTDGTHIFRSTVEQGRPMRYKPTFMSAKKFKSTGTVQLYRFDRIDPPGLDPDMALVGLAENGKLLIDVKLEGSNIKFRWGTRCNDLSRVKDALGEYYNRSINKLTIDF